LPAKIKFAIHLVAAGGTTPGRAPTGTALLMLEILQQFGRTRLAPRVSPGKTWEGVAGGLVATALVATAGAALLQLPVLGLVLISVAAAAISIIGDLTVSIFKRTVGLKDSGSLFPGHGGVLDRIDSLTAAMPLFVVCAVWLGYLQL